MWSVEAWDSDDGDDLRRDLVTSLMQALGHGLIEDDEPMQEQVSSFIPSTSPFITINFVGPVNCF